MTWVSYLLISSVVLALAAMCSMLFYRHSHKTTIEMDLLLKQMRITSRLWTGMGIYRDHLHNLDKYHKNLEDRWGNTRARIETLYGHDMGAMPLPPTLDPDLACLLVDIEENTL